MQPAGLHIETTQSGERPRYRPIGEYGVIGDCRTAALIGPDGSLDWLCMPHFDSPAIFLRLLDADKGGYFQVRPATNFSGEMAYLPATNMLQTIFTTPTGKLRLIDCMPIRARRPSASGIASYLRPHHLLHGAHGLEAGLERELGNDVAAAHRILRVVTCLEGAVDITITLRATFDYARQPAAIQMLALSDGLAGAILSADERYLALVIRRLPPTTTEQETTLRRDDDQLNTTVSLRAGERVAISLNYARTAGEARTLVRSLSTHNVDNDLNETMHYWRNWASTNRYDGPYQEAVMRSALALKLCTFEPTGAIIADPPRRCRRMSAACATGTIATPGCAIPRSRWARSVSLAITTKRATTFTFSTTSISRALIICASCIAFAVNRARIWPNTT